MQYRTDPRSGNELSVLSFGCMRFTKSLAGSFGFSIGKPIGEDKIEKLIKQTLDLRIRSFSLSNPDQIDQGEIKNRVLNEFASHSRDFSHELTAFMILDVRNKMCKLLEYMV